MSNFSSVLTVFCQLFTWMAVGDVDLHLSLMLLKKPMLKERELHEPRDYITSHNQFVWHSIIHVLK